MDKRGKISYSGITMNDALKNKMRANYRALRQVLHLSARETFALAKASVRMPSRMAYHVANKSL